MTGKTSFNVDSIAGISAPFEKPDLIVSAPSSGAVRISGWAVDSAAGQPASGVDIVVDDSAYQAAYGIRRPDVADYLNAPAMTASGFSLDIPAGALTAGDHTVHVRVISSDGQGYYETGVPIRLRRTP